MLRYAKTGDIRAMTAVSALACCECGIHLVQLHHDHAASAVTFRAAASFTAGLITYGAGVRGSGESSPSLGCYCLVSSQNVTVLRTGISHLLLTMLCTGRCGFGLSKHVKNNVLHVDDRHILHPLGKHIANYDCSTSEVRPVLFETLASHQL